MSHDTASPDTAVALDGWKALVATIPPRSPQLSARGDLAYIATDDPAVGARVRIVAPTGAAAGRTVGEHAEHTPRWSPSGRQLAFVAARPAGRRDPRRGARRFDAVDGGGGRRVARRRPAVDRRGLPRPDRRPADHRHRRRARVAAWLDRRRSAGVHERPPAPTARHRGPVDRPARAGRHRTSDGVGDLPARPRALRGDRLGRPDRVRLVRRPAVDAGPRRRASSRCTSRRGRSPPPGCRPTGHASHSSRGGRAIVGSSPAASW